MVHYCIPLANQAEHGIGIVRISKALLCRDVDVLQKDSFQIIAVYSIFVHRLRSETRHFRTSGIFRNAS